MLRRNRYGPSHHPPSEAAARIAATTARLRTMTGP